MNDLFPYLLITIPLLMIVVTSVYFFLKKENELSTSNLEKKTAIEQLVLKKNKYLQNEKLSENLKNEINESCEKIALEIHELNKEIINKSTLKN